MCLITVASPSWRNCVLSLVSVSFPAGGHCVPGMMVLGYGMKGLQGSAYMHVCTPLGYWTEPTCLMHADEQVLWWDALAWAQIHAAEVCTWWQKSGPGRPQVISLPPRCFALTRWS